MFSKINKLFSKESSSLSEDSKKLLDFLSKTLELGDKIRNEKLKSEQEKKLILDETKLKIKELIKKHEDLQQEHKETTLAIDDLKIRIKNEQDKFIENLSTLESLIKSLTESNLTNQKLHLIKQFQNFLLKNITNLMLVLKDYDVRPFRDSLKDNLIMEVDLNNSSDFDQVLNEIEIEIRAICGDVISAIEKSNLKKKKIDFEIFSPQNDCEGENGFLEGMESCSFDYNKFNY